MRFRFGAIPESPDFEPERPWQALREPSPIVAQFVAFPIGCVVVIVLGILWVVLTPSQILPENMSIGSFIASVAGITVVHELLHAAAHPGQGRSDSSVLGIWPKMMVFYAHYDGELSRNRFVVILITPFLVISVVPLMLSAVTQVGSAWAAYVSLLNAFLTCVDIFGTIVLWWQVPVASTLRNQQWYTYWKPAEE